MNNNNLPSKNNIKRIFHYLFMHHLTFKSFLFFHLTIFPFNSQDRYEKVEKQEGILEDLSISSISYHIWLNLCVLFKQQTFAPFFFFLSTFLYYFNLLPFYFCIFENIIPYFSQNCKLLLCCKWRRRSKFVFMFCSSMCIQCPFYENDFLK